MTLTSGGFDAFDFNLLFFYRRDFMTMERVVVEAVPKPWGRLDLHPWARDSVNGERIGEVWFHRADPAKKFQIAFETAVYRSTPLDLGPS